MQTNSQRRFTSNEKFPWSPKFCPARGIWSGWVWAKRFVIRANGREWAGRGVGKKTSQKLGLLCAQFTATDTPYSFFYFFLYFYFFEV